MAVIIPTLRRAVTHAKQEGSELRWASSTRKLDTEWSVGIRRRTAFLRENYDLRGLLQAHFGRFVERHNRNRYNERLKNLTSAEVNFGNAQTTLSMREKAKRDTIRSRRLQDQSKAA